MKADTNSKTNTAAVQDRGLVRKWGTFQWVQQKSLCFVWQKMGVEGYDVMLQGLSLRIKFIHFLI